MLPKWLPAKLRASLKSHRKQYNLLAPPYRVFLSRRWGTGCHARSSAWQRTGPVDMASLSVINHSCTTLGGLNEDSTNIKQLVSRELGLESGFPTFHSVLWPLNHSCPWCFIQFKITFGRDWLMRSPHSSAQLHFTFCSAATGIAGDGRPNHTGMGPSSQWEKFLLCSISLIMTQLNRPWEISNLGTCAHRDTQALAAVLNHIPQSGVRQSSGSAQAPAHKQVLFRIPQKASQVANVDICARLWLSCLCSLICQDNHFPILLNKHRLPCLNTITVLTEHTAFNHSALSTLARVWEKNQNILNVNGLILLFCKSQETGERNPKFQIKGIYSIAAETSVHFKIISELEMQWGTQFSF